MSVENFSKHCPEDFQRKSYERIINKVIDNKNCLKCKWKLEQIWRWKFKCTECKSEFTIKSEPSLFKDMSDTKNWKADCNECGKVMKFYESSFTYRCNCGNILEV